MKNISTFLLLLLVLSACSNRKEYKAEDFKKQQQEYETLKAEVSQSKQLFYTEHKAKLTRLIQKLNYLEDENTDFGAVAIDSNYYKSDILLEPLNLGHKISIYGKNDKDDHLKDLPKAKAVFIIRSKDEYISKLVFDPAKDLRSCYDSVLDMDCLSVKEEKLSELMEVQYAFVIDLMYLEKPSVTGSSQFNGGTFAGMVTFYDMEEEKALLRFVVTATSSDEIQTHSSFGNRSIGRVLESDFKHNIKEGILETCRKHFVFSNNLTVPKIGI
ncbi:hypothetical protein V6R21_24075 [Limibacter armeniacum]|uniref:hypothetical protein n=1 Tax=Limibacter armeniacum TaxID=466084 RepID=UPI002FE5C8B7